MPIVGAGRCARVRSKSPLPLQTVSSGKQSWGGLSQIQLPTSWEIYYMQLKKHILIMCRCLGIPRWSNCSSELALPPPASKPRPTCPRFRLMVATKCWERNITCLDSGSVPQPVQLEHGRGWGTAEEVQNCRRCCEFHDHKWISWRQKYIIHWLSCFSKNDSVPVSSSVWEKLLKKIFIGPKLYWL